MPRRSRKPTRKARQERSRRTVESILTAASQLLVRTGKLPTTNHVAHRAGVGIASVYEYFRSKEAIVAELQSRHTQQTRAVIKGELDRFESQPPSVAVPALVRALLDAHAVSPELHRVLGQYHGAGDEIDSIEVFGKKLVHRYLARRAKISPDRLELASVVISRSLEALTHFAALHEPALLASPDFVDEVSELLLGYIRRLETPTRMTKRERPLRSRT